MRASVIFNIISQWRIVRRSIGGNIGRNFDPNIGPLVGFAASVILIVSASPAAAQNIFDIFNPPPPRPQQQQPQQEPQQQQMPRPQRSQSAPRPQQPSQPSQPRTQQSAPKQQAAPAAAATGNAPYGEVRSACGAEIKATCAGVVPGSADSVQCLKRNIAVLSPPCQGALNRAGSQAVQPAAAPAKSTEPAGTTAEPRRVTTDRIAPSPTPDEPLKMAPVNHLRPTQEARFVNRFCREDQSLLCQGVTFGQGRVLTCLASHQTSLTSECKRALVSRR